MKKLISAKMTILFGSIINSDRDVVVHIGKDLEIKTTGSKLVSDRELEATVSLYSKEDKEIEFEEFLSLVKENLPIAFDHLSIWSLKDIRDVSKS